MSLNDTAARLCTLLVQRSEALRVGVSQQDGEPRLIDCGIEAAGGLEAGVMLAEICLAGLGRVRIAPGRDSASGHPFVTVHTDHPLSACMAAQYAGWQISGEDFFAMGSGPMRAAAGREELFDRIGHRETPRTAVGVLEAAQLPPREVGLKVARDCGVPPEELTLLVAPTASLAGTVQVVARTVETAMHKLLELGFDLQRVESGFGVAPLPPVAGNDLQGIGRTNDAVLYGGRTTLWVRGDDASLADVVPQVPSCASSDFGQPFAAIFERYERDFYKIDPLLFSPAEVTLINLDTGNSFRSGQLKPDVLEKSFAG